jgi:hypothetical protein
MPRNLLFFMSSTLKQESEHVRIPRMGRRQRCETSLSSVCMTSTLPFIGAHHKSFIPLSRRCPQVDPSPLLISSPIFPPHCTLTFFTIKSIFNSTHQFSLFISQHCRSQGKNNFECYYEPFSKCTVEDALKQGNRQGQGGSVTLNDLPLIRSEIMSKEDRKVEVPFEEALAEITKKAEGERERAGERE